jgi:hypothetical protein
VDTPILWQFDGTNATVTPLPDFFFNTNSIRGAANDISADGRYIASQAVSSPGGNWAVRVDRTLLPSAAANLNIHTAVTPPLALNTFPAAAVSSDGSIVYAGTVSTSMTSPDSRVVRFDLAAGVRSFIPSLGVDTQNSIARGGVSADGTVIVGDSFTPGPARAYRYEHGLGTAPVPFLPGGTFSRALAVSPDGDVVLVLGNSAENPNSEPYFYRASTGVVESLGTPNTPWRVGGRLCVPIAEEPFRRCNGVTLAGGMTADGSIVAMNFFGTNLDTYAYLRNGHGWFHLASVLLANGVDLASDGWTGLVIQGISEDGTLVFGAGERNGVIDGFVASFAPGVLASFNPPFVAPADSSIVGAWIIGGEPTAPEAVAVFTAEGAYYQIEEDTFEWGTYRFDGNGLTIITKHDTNGSAGISDMNGTVFPIDVVGDTLVVDGEAQGVRVVGGQGSIVGAWTTGVPTQADNSSVIVATATNHYFNVFDFPDGEAGESGTYTWNPVTGELTATPLGGEPDSGNLLLPSADGLALQVVDDGGEEFGYTRVVDPASVPAIANADLTAEGVVGQPLTYDIDATNAVTYTASGLPTGLSIDVGTGEISGTPANGGQFAATVVATNNNGVSDIALVTITIAIPTPVGQNVIVEPEVPEGQGPITISFGEITSGGTTTVTVLDPAEVPAPGNVSVAGVIYEVTTTATFEGLITLCFSYEGIDFGGSTPRLFHYENNVWVDITTSVDAGTRTICGATTSLSPFAVLASNVVRTGFHAPVNPMAGFLNTAKGGSTVPLKFNVFVNGTEQKTTGGLVLTMQQIHCDSNAPQDDVEPAPVTGGTTLRYDAAGYFIYNWKVPKTPGLCYMIRMTTLQDELALTARFKVK